jgi:polysaccharide biosynthesis protein PslH
MPAAPTPTGAEPSAPGQPIGTPMRSVVVAKYVPWPPNSGDKRRTLGVVRALRDRGEVTVCAFEGEDEDAAPLRDEGIEVRSVPHRRSVSTLARGIVRGRSISSARFYDPALHEIVREQTASDVDLLVINHVQLLPYGRGSNAALTVVDMHNIESSLTARYAASQRGPKRAVLTAETRALLRLERRACKADAVSVVSETDRQRLEEIVRDAGETPGEVVIVPNAWGEPTPLAASAEPIVSFVALLSWAPNVDAAVWFAREVWPRVVAERADARLVLVGRNPAPAVRALAGPSVEVTGTVADLEPYYAQSSLAIAPLLAGGGSRLKILEALAHARPVVATTIGAEGLEDLIGRGVQVADDPSEMAASILEILANPELGASMGAAGVAAVRADHSWDAATRPLTDLLSAKIETAR